MSEFSQGQLAVIKEVAYTAAKEAAKATVGEMKHEFEEVIPEVVKSTLNQMGHDTSNPLDMQADQAFLRKLRRAHEKKEELRAAMWFKIIGSVLTAIIMMYFAYSIGQG